MFDNPPDIVEIGGDIAAAVEDMLSDLFEGDCFLAFWAS